MTIECQDCEFTTNDEASAENHQRETDHCMADPEPDYSPEEESVMAKCNLDEEEYDRLHAALYAAIKEFGTEAVEAVYKLAEAKAYETA